LIILDTNVISALMHKLPDRIVVDWLDLQPAESVWITSVTLFEVRLGLALLPKSRRRQGLDAAFEQLLTEDLEGRVLDFDGPAAEAAAILAAKRQHAGRIVDMRDTQIAGIVLARRAALATRNTRHFADLTVEIVNPWDARSTGMGN
jgi:predicted nucleic acid-binding protein